MAVAKELLALAEDGDLHGLSFIAKLGAKDHRAGVVGDYQGSPAEALLAVLRMKKRLLDEDD